MRSSTITVTSEQALGIIEECLWDEGRPDTRSDAKGLMLDLLEQVRCWHEGQGLTSPVPSQDEYTSGEYALGHGIMANRIGA